MLKKTKRIEEGQTVSITTPPTECCVSECGITGERCLTICPKTQKSQSQEKYYNFYFSLNK